MIAWNRVTWYSKLLTIIFFVGVLPAWAFYLGTQQQLVIFTESEAIEQSTSGDGPYTGKWFEQSTVQPPVYSFKEMFRSSTNVFFCYYRLYTESACSLYLSAINSEIKEEVGIRNEFQNIIPSPDKNNLLIVGEHRARVMDTNTLAQKVVVEIPEDKVLGVYTSFPMFIGKAEWINNSSISFSIYNADNMFGDLETKPEPLEKKIIGL